MAKKDYGELITLKQGLNIENLEKNVSVDPESIDIVIKIVNAQIKEILEGAEVKAQRFAVNWGADEKQNLNIVLGATLPSDAKEEEIAALIKRCGQAIIAQIDTPGIVHYFLSKMDPKEQNEEYKFKGGLSFYIKIEKRGDKWILGLKFTNRSTRQYHSQYMNPIAKSTHLYNFGKESTKTKYDEKEMKFYNRKYTKVFRILRGSIMPITNLIAQAIGNAIMTNRGTNKVELEQKIDSILLERSSEDCENPVFEQDWDDNFRENPDNIADALLTTICVTCGYNDSEPPGRFWPKSEDDKESSPDFIFVRNAITEARKNGIPIDLNKIPDGLKQVCNQDDFSTTALMFAAKKTDIVDLRKRLSLVIYLIKNGADPAIKDKNNHDASWYAKQAGNYQIYEFLNVFTRFQESVKKGHKKDIKDFIKIIRCIAESEFLTFSEKEKSALSSIENHSSSFNVSLKFLKNFPKIKDIIEKIENDFIKNLSNDHKDIEFNHTSIQSYESQGENLINLIKLGNLDNLRSYIEDLRAQYRLDDFLKIMHYKSSTSHDTPRSVTEKAEPAVKECFIQEWLMSHLEYCYAASDDKMVGRKKEEIIPELLKSIKPGSSYRPFLQDAALKLYFASPKTFDKRLIPIIEDTIQFRGTCLIQLLKSNNPQKLKDFINSLRDLNDDFRQIIKYQNPQGETPLGIAKQKEHSFFIDIFCQKWKAYRSINGAPILDQKKPEYEKERSIREIQHLYKLKDSSINSLIKADILKLYSSSPKNCDQRLISLISDSLEFKGEKLINLVISGQRPAELKSHIYTLQKIERDYFHKIITYRSAAHGETALTMAIKQGKHNFVEIILKEWLISGLTYCISQSDFQQEIIDLYDLEHNYINQKIQEELMCLYCSAPKNFPEKLLPIIKDTHEFKSNHLINLVQSGKTKDLENYINTLKDECKSNEDEGESNDLEKIINYKNKDGDTPLIIAVMNKNCDLIDTLCKAGADLQKTNRNGKRPIELFENESNPVNIRLRLWESRTNFIDEHITLFRNFCQLLVENFLKTGKPEIAKAFHRKILEFGLILLNESLKFNSHGLLGFSDEIKEIVTACKLTQHNPETPKELPQYDTHQGISLFNQICKTAQEGKEDQANTQELLSLYKNFNRIALQDYKDYKKGPLLKFIFANHKILTATYPHPAETIAQQIFLHLCTDQAVTLEMQDSLIELAEEKISSIRQTSMAPIQKIYTIMDIRNLIVETSILKPKLGEGYLISPYKSKTFDGDIIVSAKVKKLENSCLEYVAKVFHSLMENEKLRLTDNFKDQNPWVLAKEYDLSAPTPNPDLEKMRNQFRI